MDQIPDIKRGQHLKWNHHVDLIKCDFKKASTKFKNSGHVLITIH